MSAGKLEQELGQTVIGVCVAHARQKAGIGPRVRGSQGLQIAGLAFEHLDELIGRIQVVQRIDRTRGIRAIREACVGTERREVTSSRVMPTSAAPASAPALAALPALSSAFVLAMLPDRGLQHSAGHYSSRPCRRLRT